MDNWIEAEAQPAAAGMPRWVVPAVVVAVIAVVATAFVGIASHEERGEQVAASAGAGPEFEEQLDPPPDRTPDTNVPAPSIPSTSITMPTLPTVTIPEALRVPAPKVVTPRPPTTPAPRPVATGRPPCPGEEWGYGGFGCRVTRTSGGFTIHVGAYGQVLQVNRDRLQQHIEVGQSGGRVLRSLRYTNADGTTEERTVNASCANPTGPHSSQFSMPTRTGVFDITTTVSHGTCTDTGEWADVQSFQVTIPVRVCNKIENMNGEVVCLS